jgi:hypothetical protein
VRIWRTREGDEEPFELNHFEFSRSRSSATPPRAALRPAAVSCAPCGAVRTHAPSRAPPHAHNPPRPLADGAPRVMSVSADDAEARAAAQSHLRRTQARVSRDLPREPQVRFCRDRFSATGD